MTELTARTTSPFRFDIVGSFLRPQELKDARAKYAKGEISKPELTEVENHCIEDLIKKEEAAGLKAVTDGEFRRAIYSFDTLWGFEGIDNVDQGHGVKFHNDTETPSFGAAVTGKIKYVPGHPDVEAFKYLYSITKDNPQLTARQSIPAPAVAIQSLSLNSQAIDKHYPNHEDFIHDVAKAFHELILALYDAGCRDIKLDDTSWDSFLTNDYWGTPQDTEESKQLAHDFLEANNLALQDLPNDLVISTHFCRGNFKSEYLTTGGYDRIAKYLFEQEPRIDTFFLEYDDERAGSFAPLQEIPDNTNVVLGLVTSKRPELEDKATVIKRIKEASQYIPLERLAISPQCGFASTEEGNNLTEEQQWAKIKLIKEIAEEVWG